MSADLEEAMPAITAQPTPHGSQPEYVIQCYSPETRAWRNWDCALTRTEARNLLATYERRFRTKGLDWRIAKIVYTEAPAAVTIQ
jgi:hypothetical protein